MAIDYNPDKDKILETLLFVAEQCSGRDIHHLLKVIYYSDKFHLEKYGRPVTGDTYIKMEAGPVASYVYDLLKQEISYASREHLSRIDATLSIDRSGNHPIIHSKGKADSDYLSLTDQECIKKAVLHCRHKTFLDLYNETHQEQSWIKADLNRPMNYENFISENDQDREEKVRYIRENAPTLVF